MNGETVGQRTGDPALRLGQRRLRLIGVVFGIAFASIALRLIDMTNWQGNVLAPKANAALPSTRLEPPASRRADIVDRNGVVLATNFRVPSVFANPSLLADKADAARRLARILPGVEAAALQTQLENGKQFAWVKHRITPEEQQAVLELGLPGVGFRWGEERVYPKGPLASHIVGYTNIDGKGLAGVERALDQRLSSSNVPLALSLDMRIQQIAREELFAAYRRFRAIGGNALVLDRVTGEVLAMVSLPDFDPNRVGDVTRVEYLNRNTAGLYELGSVFKILTIAMALDSGKIAPSQRFDATGKLRIGRHSIGDDHAKNRWLSVPEIFMHSSNIGTARMAFEAGGAAPLEQFFKKLGFYAPPQIEISEVARPTVPKEWKEVTVATTSFGHGIAVTPLQFVDAVAGLIGDGTRIPPTVVKRSPDALPQRTRLVAPETAEHLRSFMWLTVEKGTGTRAKLATYAVGGKTGTADKPVHGRYVHGKVLASFIGAFPIHDPRYLVFVTLDEPQGDKETYGFRYGGWTAAPVVAKIIDRIGPLLRVPPTPPEVARAYRERLTPMVSELLEKPGRQEASVAAGKLMR